LQRVRPTRLRSGRFVTGLRGPVASPQSADGALGVLERRHAAIRPGEDLGAIVGGEDDNDVIGLADIVEALEQGAEFGKNHLGDLNKYLPTVQPATSREDACIASARKPA
jgi:hypothetical protein